MIFPIVFHTFSSSANILSHSAELRSNSLLFGLGFKNTDGEAWKTQAEKEKERRMDDLTPHTKSHAFSSVLNDTQLCICQDFGSTQTDSLSFSCFDAKAKHSSAQAYRHFPSFLPSVPHNFSASRCFLPSFSARGLAVPRGLK